MRECFLCNENAVLSFVQREHSFLLLQMQRNRLSCSSRRVKRRRHHRVRWIAKWWTLRATGPRSTNDRV